MMDHSRRVPGQPDNLSPEECQRIQENILNLGRAQVNVQPALNVGFYMFEFGLILACSSPFLASECLEATLPMGLVQLPYEPPSAFFKRCYARRASLVYELEAIIEKGR